MLQNVPADLDLHVTLLGKELRPVLAGSAKDLEVHMNATLSSDDHIKSISSSCLTSLCQLNRVKRLLNTDTFLETLSMHESLANSTTVLPFGLVRRIGISINYSMFKTSQLGTRSCKFDHITNCS